MACNRSNPTENLHMAMDPKQESEKDLIPRSYQLEILEAAKRTNTIACLGTGTGKTFIAVMLIREFADEVRLPYDGNGKRIFFLVPTVPLVHQQGKTIAEHTDLKVKEFCGEMNVDSWNKDKWFKEFVNSEVLVMTAEIFRIIVDHAFIPLNKIKLIIFDECHRAQKDHPYSQAMKCFSSLSENELPRIFGLSASLINGKCKPTKLEKQLLDLEKTLRCSITTASDVIDLQRYGADPKEYIVCYKPFYIETNLFGHIHKLRDDIKNMQTNLGRGNEALIDAELEFFDKPLRCLNALEMTLRNLGSWCAYKAAECFLEEVKEVLNKQVIYRRGEQETLEQLCSFLDYFIIECHKINFEITKNNLGKFPHKLIRLLDIFLSMKNSEKFLKEPIPSVDSSFDEDPEKYHQILKAKEEENSSSIQLCSLVFVEQRITAFVLQQWILEIKKVLPELNFLEPEYIVGHGNTGVKKTSMSEKRQKGVLSDFRQKRCNVLISTNVLEEGMDVQQCNLVIRFDLPGDFRGYIQSKGRARAKNSLYILMSEVVGDRHNKFCEDLCNFKTVEKMLLDKCHNRVVPNEEDIREFMENDVIPPFMPYGKTGARITLVSAISLINRYCASLPSDMATKLTAKWTINEVDPDNPIIEYECTLKMPINSPLRDAIVGPKLRKKKLAKMAAALKACELLYEKGELNEHLVPVSSILQNTIEEELGSLEKENGDGAIPGTKRRRQIYDRHVPIFLQNSLPQPSTACYLHIFTMKLIEPLASELNPRNRPIKDPNSSPRTFGILLSKKLPKVPSFPIFTKVGKIEVSISVCHRTFTLSNEELKNAEDFHKFIFSDTLHLGKKMTFHPSSSRMPFYVVPVNKDDTSLLIDWSFMKTVKNHPYHDLIKKSSKTIGCTKFPDNSFKDAVLLRSYKIDCWKYEKPTYHHVIRITDKTPNSICDFKDSAMSFKEYFKNKYQVDIQNEEQLLVETFTNGNTVYWKPLYVSVKEVFTNSETMSKSKARRKNYREYLVPELSIIHPFPSSFFLQVQYLPTVLFRLHSLLLAEEIRQSVASCGLVGIEQIPSDHHWPYFDLGSSDKELNTYLYKLRNLSYKPAVFVPEDIVKVGGIIKSFTRDVNLHDHPGPNPSLILQALTSKSAGDEFDLERLEMIGDSFLKYAISVKTYIKYPTFDEGKLTKLRSSLIQNLHLYQCAKKRQLGEFLICTTFSCETTWLPPCYVIHENPDKRIISVKAKGNDVSELQYVFFTKQIISDKCVADAVEALIGTYLLSCGQKGALMFMHWIGLDPLIKEKNAEVVKEDFINWPPPPPSVIVGQVPNIEEALFKLTDGLERFEANIKYKFKDKALLVQAFTHPSYHYNEITDCYQRLEFLGDAVLDFLITRQLYEDPHDLSPGSLTDLRSALVNNIYFACLAVKYKYHKYLKMLSPHLFGLMRKFLDIFEPSEYFTFFKEHGYALEEIECFELDEVEIPKALGDLFESVAGAIYLDSGMSLDTVWKVYYPMLQPAICHLSEHVPKSPVRELYEELKRKDVFSKIISKGEKTYVIVKLPNGKEIEGVGPNKKVAKRSAAKRALAEMKKEKENKGMSNSYSKRYRTNVPAVANENSQDKLKNSDMENNKMKVKERESDVNVVSLKNIEEAIEHMEVSVQDTEETLKRNCESETEKKEKLPVEDTKTEIGANTSECIITLVKRKTENSEEFATEICPKKVKKLMVDKPEGDDNTCSNVVCVDLT